MKDEPNRAPVGPILVEVAPGELIDKITILRIKAERLPEGPKLHNVGVELGVLEAAWQRAVPPLEELTRLTADLKGVNEALWQIEDDVRDCERRQDFGPRFVQLARSVYHTNDRRAELKRRVNDLLGSRIVEEKSYAEYRNPESQP
jgi:hypothetical protein